MAVATAFKRTLPRITQDNAGFWKSCREHRMRLQKCANCGGFRYFPSPICMYCGTFEHTWEPVAGTATIYSYSIVYRAPNAGWADEVPYVHAIVQLDEGPMMPTIIRNVDLKTVNSGMRVKVLYEDATPEISIPMFEPIPLPE